MRAAVNAARAPMRDPLEEGAGRLRGRTYSTIRDPNTEATCPCDTKSAGREAGPIVGSAPFPRRCGPIGPATRRPPRLEASERPAAGHVPVDKPKRLGRMARWGFGAKAGHGGAGTELGGARARPSKNGNREMSAGRCSRSRANAPGAAGPYSVGRPGRHGHGTAGLCPVQYVRCASGDSARQRRSAAGTGERDKAKAPPKRGLRSTMARPSLRRPPPCR